MLKEFRTFINRGNVIDLAVGVVIGTAFGKIITSLVEDIIYTFCLSKRSYPDCRIASFMYAALRHV